LKDAVECVICNSRRLKPRKALVAPFIARRVWDRKSFPVRLLECADCGFAFFSPRLEEDEEQRLYRNYRGEAYQQMRYLFEPWYTKRFNDSLFCDGTMSARRELLKRILAPYLAKTKVRSILDFGGGKGELIFDLVRGADRYVYDPSGTEPLPGIEELETLTDCKAHRYDLIVCSNVLEHVAYPRDVLRQIADVASPGTAIFLEVPDEPPFSYRHKAKRLLQWTVLLPTRPTLALSLAGPGIVSLMQEHVNFFSPTALGRLMSSMGLEIQASGSYGKNSLMNTKTLWSLGCQKGAQARWHPA